MRARPPRAPSALRRFAPSPRSVLVGVAIAVAAVAAYFAARESSAFAVRRIEVAGAPATVRADVRRALAPLVGTSLLALDGAALERRVESLPEVVAAGYDRGFPHTLRVLVVAERPTAVLRRGAEAWLVSARGRVLARIPRHAEPALPRLWVPRATGVAAGALLPPEVGATAARALALLERTAFPVRIVSAASPRGDLSLGLAGGVELRLGDASDLRLKLAIARRIVVQLPAGAAYVDVSVPERPVVGTNPQVSGGG